MKLLLPNEALDRDTVSNELRARGFELVEHEPLTNGARWSVWQRGDDAVGYVTRPSLGTWALKIQGPAEDDLAEELRTRLPSRTADEILAAAPAGDTLAKVRHAFALATVSALAEGELPSATARLFELLSNDEPLVRWATLRVLPLSRETLAVLAEVGTRFPEMLAVRQRLAPHVVAVEEGTLNDYDTDDRDELLRRAREGAAALQWKRVAKAMDVLLAESPWDDEALELRAGAHEAGGELVDALALLGASAAKLAGAVEAAKGAERLEQIRAKLAALAPGVRELRAEAKAAGRDRLVARLAAWQERRQTELVCGAAGALRGVLGELEGLLCYFDGEYRRDAALLAQAERLVPDAPSVSYQLALDLLERDPAAARQRFEALRARLRDPVELSAEATLLERLVAARGESHVTTEARVLETLAKQAYEMREYDRAASLADEIVRLDPDTGIGWQLRANARIFALRHEEAATACREAIANLDRIYACGEEEDSVFFGSDPRAGMHFNLSCVLAKLGQRDEAIASLRQAVLRDEKYATEATADDYMQALFDDPEFRAITSLDPTALRTPEEREPAWVKALVARARDEQQAGNLRQGLATAQRAAELAEPLADAALRVEALAVLGRMQTLTGDVEAGLETTERAVDGAGDEQVSPETRAVAHAQRGICLQAAGRLDEAEAAYERALDERRRAFGETHPLVVKSIVAIVGVALARERPASEIEARITRGIDIAQSYLASEPHRDHVWAEAIDDVVSLLLRRALLRVTADEHAHALPPMALAFERLEEQRAGGHVPMAAVVDQLAELASSIQRAAGTPEVARRAGMLIARAEALLVSGPAAERPARLLFRRVRAFVEQLRTNGVDDARIASLFADTVRGGEALAEELRNLPVLAELRTLLATAAARTPTMLVTAAMALSLASQPGRLDESLRQLEELVVPVVAETDD